MLTDAELASVRATQELIMVDSGELRRAGTQKFNPATRRIEGSPGATFYSGPMIVQSREANVNQLLIGDDREIMQDFVIKVPWDVTLPEDTIECVVHDSRDPDLIGRVITIPIVGRQTFVTCRRMIGTVSGVVEDLLEGVDHAER